MKLTQIPFFAVLLSVLLFACSQQNGEDGNVIEEGMDEMASQLEENKTAATEEIDAKLNVLMGQWEEIQAAADDQGENMSNEATKAYEAMKGEYKIAINDLTTVKNMVAESGQDEFENAMVKANEVMQESEQKLDQLSGKMDEVLNLIRGESE